MPVYLVFDTRPGPRSQAASQIFFGPGLSNSRLGSVAPKSRSIGPLVHCHFAPVCPVTFACLRLGHVPGGGAGAGEARASSVPDAAARQKEEEEEAGACLKVVEEMIAKPDGRPSTLQVARLYKYLTGWVLQWLIWKAIDGHGGYRVRPGG